MAAWQDLYPFTSHRLDLDGLSYHYLDEGEGPVVLLLHGNPTWSFYYRNLVLGLRDRYRVIVPDHIGCGLSDKPQDYPYHLATHVENLTRLVDHLGIERLSLGVHDWGGPIGLGWAVAHADLVDRLVVFNTTCMLTTKYPWRILVCRWPLLGPVALRGFNLFARLATVFGTSRGLDPAVKAGLLAPYDSWANRIATLRFVQDIPLSPGHPSWAPGKAVMGRLDCLADKPMLICWGGQDFCFNDHFLDGWRERFPHADVHRFADAGHYVVEDAHEKILPLLRDFLEKEPVDERP